MHDSSSLDPLVVVHRANSPTEAMVIRGLLESAGIEAPDSTAGKPLTMHAHPTDIGVTDIAVLASQADDARRIIAEYLSPNEGVGMEHSDE